MNKLDKNISKLQKEMHSIVKTKMTRDAHLHKGEYAVMSFVAKYHDKTGQKPTLVAISEKVGITQATITPLVDRLIKKGLLIKEVSEKDRRAKLLSITEMGNEILNKQKQQEYDKIKSILEHLGEDDTEELIRIVKKISAYVTEKK